MEKRRRYHNVPAVDVLEARMVPSAMLLQNYTLDRALTLGDLSISPRLQASGSIGASGSASEVQWYSFSLDRAATVSITSNGQGAAGAPATVLSLYTNGAPSLNDPFDPYGFHMLAQDDSADHAGRASLSRSLSGGITYYLAVSGSGNRYFQPFIAGSGFSGAAGDYQLILRASDLGIRPTDSPVVLATDPGPDARLDRSPFVVRVFFSGPVAGGAAAFVGNVQLSYKPSGSLDNVNYGSIQLSPVYFSTATNELLLKPAAPLARGVYQLTLHASGHDFTSNFTINGTEGVAGTRQADDTPDHAHQLGDITSAGLVQLSGGIGDDPSNPIPFDPADVDLYRFAVSGSGHFSLQAEVFGGRIGSPLDPALSLFWLDPKTGQLQLAAFNESTLNPTVTDDGRFAPLHDDPAFTAALQPGEYFVAVSGSANVPRPDLGLFPGKTGIFDPTISHSGKNGFTIGNYVLNLLVSPDNEPPKVASIALADGSELTDHSLLASPPTGFIVRFSEPVNLSQLFLQSFLATGKNATEVACIYGDDGSKHYLRSQSVSADGTEFSFILYDALSDGSYQLVLSGAKGLTDFAGNALAGNTETDDYVLHFTVQAPLRGVNGNPLRRLDEEPNNDPAHAQDLGVLFPEELTREIVLTRGAISGPELADQSDYFQFTVFQSKLYDFALSNLGSSADLQIAITGLDGQLLASSATGTSPGTVLFSVLNPGTYRLVITGWLPTQAATIRYQVGLAIGGAMEEPGPLAIGAAPAIRLRPIPVGLPPSLDTTGNSNVIPASDHSATSGATRGLLTQAPAAIPPDVLLALATDPVSGIDGRFSNTPTRVADLYERVLARAPVFAQPELLLQLPVLLQTGHDGSAVDSSSGGLTPIWESIIRRLEKIDWRQAVDLLHRLQMETLDLPASPELFQERNEQQDDQQQRPGTDGMEIELSSPEVQSDSSTPSAALAVAGLAVLAGNGWLPRVGREQPMVPGRKARRKSTFNG